MIRAIAIASASSLLVGCSVLIRSVGLTGTPTPTPSTPHTLSVSPNSASVNFGSQMTFSTSGGTPPYTYSISDGPIQSGRGSIDASTGVYTSPGNSGVITISVTDANAGTGEATIQVGGGQLFSLFGNGSNNEVYVTDDSETWALVSTSVTRNGGAGYVYRDKLWFVGGANGGSVKQSSVYSSSDGVVWTLTGSIPVALTDITGVVHNDKMWVVGGMNAAFSGVNTVYHSTDGITWTAQTPLPAALFNVALASFNGKLWVLGGRDTSNYPVKSVYSTTDGTSWTVEADLPTYLSSATGRAVVAFDKMYLMGAQRDVNEKQGHVYFTSDGITWTSVDNLWNGANYYAGSSAFFGQQFLMTQNVGSNDMARSKNGLAWTKANTPTLPGLMWTALLPFTVTASDLKLTPLTYNVDTADTLQMGAFGGTAPYVFSIQSGSGTIDAVTGLFTAPGAAGTTVVRVTDAVSATLTATLTIVDEPQIYPTQLTMNQNSQVTFGATGGVPPYTYSIVAGPTYLGRGTINPTTGLYTSPPNSSNTIVVRVTDSLSQYTEAPVIVGSDTAWIFAGWNGIFYDSVHSTNDGTNFDVETFLPIKLSDMRSIVFRDKIWLLGGIGEFSSLALNAIYTSKIDSQTGVLSWETVPGRELPLGIEVGGVTVFNDKIYYIAGQTDDANPGTARTTSYSSSDGLTWTLEGNIPSARSNVNTTVYNNKMWIVGGTDTGGGQTSTVYSSVDGATWVTETALSGGSAHGILTGFNDQLWLFCSGSSNQARMFNNTTWFDFSAPAQNENDVPTVVIGTTSQSLISFGVSGGNGSATSSDGTTWVSNPTALPHSAYWFDGVAYTPR